MFTTAKHHKNKSTEAAQTLTFNVAGKGWRVLLMACLVLSTTALIGYSLIAIFSPNDLTGVEIAQFALCLLLFAWLATAFWTAIIGFTLNLLGLDPLSLRNLQPCPSIDSPLENRYAVIMPVYNEDAQRVVSGFEACVREILTTKHSQQFDFYMLSDTNNNLAANEELAAWQALIARLGEFRSHLFYRRRVNNSERKVGNIKDFCQRWGRNYEAMIVLDADSIMSAQRMIELALRIESNPQTALIQTIPMPVGQSTFFARFVQFASHLYSPMLATGLSFWQTDSANYWGHNAIVRIRPFMQCCGLPSLPGKGPLAGDIYSHDFVEAALLRRAGWHAYLLTDSTGSYEEVPTNIVDYAIRDRRWVQGNIQHLGLLNTKGLKWVSRLHFIFGAFAYMASLTLLIVLMLGSYDALIKAFTPAAFFTSAHQLFPDWPVVRQELMFTTLAGTVAMLSIPKLLGFTLAMIKRREQFGGGWSLFKGFVMEFVVATLIAPLMMLFHSFFVISVLLGVSVEWRTQQRVGETLSWAKACRSTQYGVGLAVIWGASTLAYTPSLTVWLIPTLVGLILAPVVVRMSSSSQWGLALKRRGIFLINEELQPCRSLRFVDHELNQAKPLPSTTAKPDLLQLPAENWHQMPLQNLTELPLPATAVQQAAV